MSEAVDYKPHRLPEAQLRDEAIRTYDKAYKTVFRSGSNATIIGGVADPDELDRMRKLLPELERQILGTP